MTQGILPYKYEQERMGSGVTALAGLPVYFDLMQAARSRDGIEKHVVIRRDGQGWKDSQVVTSLIMLNLAGGDCVDDLEILEKDEGFYRVLRRVEFHRLPRSERRKIEKAWRKERSRTVPSQSAVFRYPGAFHEAGQEKLRQEGKAFIPEPNEQLKGLAKVNAEAVGFICIVRLLNVHF